jgi:hypothetical protein
VATKVAQIDWVHAHSAGSSFSVAIPTPTAGHMLIFCSAGGVITTPSGFTRGPAYGGGAQDVSIWDKTATGTETSIAVSLGGSENCGGTILEYSGSLTYNTGSNNGSGATPAQSSDYQVVTGASSVSAQSLAIAVWSVNQSSAFSVSNQFRQMGPAGAIVRSAGAQDASGFPVIFAVGHADIDATHQYPQQASAGSYAATSVYQGASAGTGFACQAIFTDTSGVATVAFPNAIAQENSLPGTDNGNWYLNTAGTDATIAGFPTTPSVQPGGTVNFKVGCAFTFHAEIYRLGFYGYDTFGARNVLGNQGGYLTGTVVSQPTPAVDGTLGSTSCAAWTTNVTWSVPANAVPGVYYVIFRRTDAGNTSKAATTHFIVRESSPSGKIAMVLPDLTHHAYNVWGAITDHGDLSTGTWTGRSLYQAGADGASSNIAHRAYAVCLDRPYSVQSTQEPTYIFDSEFGFIQFCEAQGYNLTYLSDMDLEGSATLLNSAALVAMVGHHEYWTANMYSAFQNAVAAGVNLFAYSANTGGWRVRFAAADTNKRTAICYKDGITRDVAAGWSGTGYDPLTPTGTWRDAGATNGVANPDRRLENSLTGQRFVASGPLQTPMLVDFTVKTKPIWRNSAGVQALTTGNHITDISNSVGYEADAADGAAGQPSNLVIVASTSVSITTGANAAGTVYSSSITLTATWTLYRDVASGALVFATGNWRSWWSTTRWHGASPVASVSVDIQNALLAILYDLGAAPQTLTALQPGADTALTSPATGAPTAGNGNVAVAYGLAVPTTLFGAVTLAATGALTATAVDVVAGAATLSTTGTLGTTGLAIDRGAATLSATGALGTTATYVGASAAAMSATGAVTAAAVDQIAASAMMSSAPTVSATAVKTAVSTAALSSTPALAATGTATTTGAAALSSTPAVSTSATRTALGSVALAATGVLAATGTVTTSTTSTLACAPILSASGLGIMPVAGSLVCISALGALAVDVVAAASTLACVPALGAPGLYVGVATAALACTAVLGSNAVDVVSTAATLAATPTLAATAAYLGLGTVTLSATGSLAATGAATISAVVGLASEPALTAAGLHVSVAAVTLSVTGAMATSAVQVTAGAVTLACDAVVSANAIATTSGAATLGTEPTVTAAGVLGVVNLVATGVMFVDIFGGAFVADLSTTGTLSAGAVISTAGAADLAATGVLDVSTVVILDGSAALSVTANLNVGAAVIAVSVAVLASTPTLTSTPLRLLTAAVTLSTTGAVIARTAELFLVAEPRLTALAIGVPHGAVALSATGTLTAVVRWTVRGTVSLASTPTLAISATRGQSVTAALACESALSPATSATSAAALVCEAALIALAGQGFDTHVILMRCIAVLGATAVHPGPSAAALSATGALSANMALVRQGVAALSTVGLLLSAVQYAQYNPVALVAIGALHAGGFITRPSWPYRFVLLPDRWAFEILENTGGGD